MERVVTLSGYEEVKSGHDVHTKQRVSSLFYRCRKTVMGMACALVPSSDFEEELTLTESKFRKMKSLVRKGTQSIKTRRSVTGVFLGGVSRSPGRQPSVMGGTKSEQHVHETSLLVQSRSIEAFSWKNRMTL